MLMQNNALYRETFSSSSYPPKRFLHSGIMRYLWRPRLWFRHEGNRAELLVMLAFLPDCFVNLHCACFARQRAIISPGYCRMQELNLHPGQYIGVHIRRGDKGDDVGNTDSQSACVTVFSVSGGTKEAEAVATDRYVDQTLHFLAENRALTAVYVASDTQAVVEEFCK